MAFARDLLDAALRDARAGRFAQAEKKLRRVLREPLNQHQAATIQRMLGDVYASQGNYRAAVKVLGTAASKNPADASILASLFNSFMGAGQIELAIETAEKAVALAPADSSTHYNLGIALYGNGDLDGALASYQQALRLNPEDADAHNNLGVAHQEQGDWENAIASYRRAIQLRPQFAEAHNNLGNALCATGDWDGAIESCEQALTIHADYADAYNNLANALKEKGELERAIASYAASVSLAPEKRDVWRNLAMLLASAAYKNYEPDLVDLYLKILEQETLVRPTYIVRSILGLLQKHPRINACLNRSESEIGQNLEDTVAAVAEVPLLLRTMEICPLPDVQFERLAREIRKELLFRLDALSNDKIVLAFQVSLALQCFTNEFVYGESEEEVIAVRELEKRIEGDFASGKMPVLNAIACLASYKTLHPYDWSDKLKGVKEIKALFVRQVQDIETEAELRENIPVLKEIDGPVSVAVRRQYEENPYPRWVNTQLEHGQDRISSLAVELDLRIEASAAALDAKPEILIAGCGTGQNSLSTASRFPSSQVLAVDLSLTSLAYAERRAEELGIANITYMQADILDLGALDRKFDLIESIGVLHHMDNPMEGWSILTDCLKSGGFMKIGLYSDAARQFVVEARDQIAEMGLGDGIEDIRNFRKHVIESGDRRFEKLISSNDFYSASALRDLAFHVQEHRFAPRQIKDCLARLGLAFCGFEFASEDVVKKFTLAYPDSDARYDLDQWHDFERSHPSAFVGMYQFWVQKVDAQLG